MALFKCKECGGDIQPTENGLGKCLYCGAIQTLPKDKDEKISQILNRANDFRLNCDFDRAIFEYEKVLELDETEPEAHWGIFLSRYGVEYVKDTMSLAYKPTLHRISSTSVFDDVDYQATLKYASFVAGEQYKKDAALIESVMKELLLLSFNQEPYDIFLSYKELDDITRQRTDDSYLAHDLYNELSAQGYKVFFAPKSLIGVSLYEPKIYSAIISAKVMIVLGTKPQYLEGVWVKNEWSRFAEAIEQGEDKVLIPVFKNMEAGQLPNRIAKYQAYNMASISFLPSLLDAISKSVKRDSKINFDKNTSAEDANLERGFLFLEDSNFSSADSYFEKVLDINPHNSQAYFGKLMVEMQVNKQSLILTSSKYLKHYANFEKAVRFADQQLKTNLLQYEEKVQYAIDEPIYNKAVDIISGNNPSESDYEKAAKTFNSISSFKDAKEKEAFCLEKVRDFKKDAIISEAKSKMVGKKISNYEAALKLLETIAGCKDADELIISCQKKIEEIKVKEKARAKKKKILLTTGVLFVAVIAVFIILMKTVIIPNGKYNDAIALMDDGDIIEAYEALIVLNGYKDSNEKAKSIYNEYIAEKSKNIEIGDNIFFGSYEQDNKTSNGKEAIEWVVLEKKDNKVLVISKYGLEAMGIHASNIKVTWETCTLRTWLNNDFINSTFTTEEKNMIPTVTVSADKNPEYSTSPGNVTEDKVFLLSIAEVYKYLKSSEARQCDPTDYSVANGVLGNKRTGTCWWWLRTQGFAQEMTAGVDSDGNVHKDGNSNNASGGVRPVMWINFSE